MPFRGSLHQAKPILTWQLKTLSLAPGFRESLTPRSANRKARPENPKTQSDNPIAIAERHGPSITVLRTDTYQFALTMRHNPN